MAENDKDKSKKKSGDAMGAMTKAAVIYGAIVAAKVGHSVYKKYKEHEAEQAQAKASQNEQRQAAAASEAAQQQEGQQEKSSKWSWPSFSMPWSKSSTSAQESNAGDSAASRTAQESNAGAAAASQNQQSNRNNNGAGGAQGPRPLVNPYNQQQPNRSAAAEEEKKDIQPRQQQQQFQKQMDSSDMDIESMQCPITMETIREPASTIYGHIYEMSAIKAWVTQKGTCPMTQQRLTLDQVYPQYGLRQTIEEMQTMKARNEEQKRRIEELEASLQASAANQNSASQVSENYTSQTSQNVAPYASQTSQNFAPQGGAPIPNIGCNYAPQGKPLEIQKK